MTVFLYVLAGVLFAILVIKIARDISDQNYVRHNWPDGLSNKTTIEVWHLYLDPGEERLLVRDKKLYLCDYAFFFLAGFKVPEGSGENNGVVLLGDMNDIYGNDKVMTKLEFKDKYRRYQKFKSYREYFKYEAKL